MNATRISHARNGLPLLLMVFALSACEDTSTTPHSIDTSVPDAPDGVVPDAPDMGIPEGTVSAVLGTEGGALVSEDGRVILDIPADALLGGS